MESRASKGCITASAGLIIILVQLALDLVHEFRHVCCFFGIRTDDLLEDDRTL